MTDGYRIRKTETWDQARQAYLSGQSAEAVCARFGLGLSAVRQRARGQGWRRADLADPEPEPLDETDHDEVVPEVDLGETVRIAAAQMTLAARRGRVDEALRWGRLHDIALCQHEAKHRTRQRGEQLDRRAREHATTDTLRQVTDAMRAANTYAKAALATPLSEADVHDVHDLHPLSDDAPQPTPDEPPLSRAERRRRLRTAEKRR